MGNLGSENFIAGLVLGQLSALVVFYSFGIWKLNDHGPEPVDCSKSSVLSTYMAWLELLFVLRGSAWLNLQTASGLAVASCESRNGFPR